MKKSYSGGRRARRGEGRRRGPARITRELVAGVGEATREPSGFGSPDLAAGHCTPRTV